MSINLRKLYLFSFSFVLLFALYWPALQGTPIWDDVTYWFSDPIMKPEFPYLKIWTDFSWPVSVSLQKILFNFFEKNYFIYHVINLVIHFANSLLVYRLGRVMQIKYPLFYFFLFLLHPAAVITTAWMVQIKTLLCFFFGLFSLLIFVKSQKNFKWMALSWLLFALSVFSKSASLTLPIIFLVIHYRFNRLSKIYLLIPFFVLSGWNAFKILSSKVTLEGTEKAATITQIKDVPEEASPEVTVTDAPSEPVPESIPEVSEVKETPPVDESKIDSTSVEIADLPEDIQRPIDQFDDKTTLKFIGLDPHLISQTMYYYFWQSLVPNNTIPVKGLNYQKAGVTELIHLFFLITMVFLFWKDSGLVYLGAAHFLILPFLGFIPAPYMTITWVSDQHLYLVLPAILAFWMRVFSKIQWKYAFALPLFFTLVFSYKTFKTTPTFNNQFVFYERSLKYNPYNIPLIYNLALAHLLEGRWQTAYALLSDAYFEAQSEEIMQKNIYYPYLVFLYAQINTVIELKKKGEADEN